MSTQRHWDIFCTVIDNYGDIGVTWRLARQLATEYGFAVRLWVDDLDALRRLCPQASTADAQRIAGVEIRRWTRAFPETHIADVVIAAFACALPSSYIEAMTRREPRPLWINLDYLSAENWVGDCHGLPSPQPGDLRKFFFFPGFTDNTGGLIREHDLIARRTAFQASEEQKRAFLQSVIDIAPPSTDTRVVSLFAYENPAIPALLEQWTNDHRATLCLVPEGRALPQVAQFFGAHELAPHSICRRGALSIEVLPFLAQDDYDRLLWSCDLNFVRGEDSFLRALWAARPLIWQIYPQAEDAHWPKLDAFLELYCTGLAPAQADALRACWRAWNGAGGMASAWARFEQHLPYFRSHAGHWCALHAQHENLAQRLVQFCANQV